MYNNNHMFFLMLILILISMDIMYSNLQVEFHLFSLLFVNVFILIKRELLLIIIGLMMHLPTQIFNCYLITFTFIRIGVFVYWFFFHLYFFINFFCSFFVNTFSRLVLFLTSLLITHNKKLLS